MIIKCFTNTLFKTLKVYVADITCMFQTIMNNSGCNIDCVCIRAIFS